MPRPKTVHVGSSPPTPGSHGCVGGDHFGSTAGLTRRRWNGLWLVGRTHTTHHTTHDTQHNQNNTTQQHNTPPHNTQTTQTTQQHTHHTHHTLMSFFCPEFSFSLCFLSRFRFFCPVCRFLFCPECRFLFCPECLFFCPVCVFFCPNGRLLILSRFRFFCPATARSPLRVCCVIFAPSILVKHMWPLLEQASTPTTQQSSGIF